jgi:hypothetical protein
MAKISLSVLLTVFNLYLPEAYLQIFSSDFGEYLLDFCFNIAPQPSLEASVSMMKYWSSKGNYRGFKSFTLSFIILTSFMSSELKYF